MVELMVFSVVDALIDAWHVLLCGKISVCCVPQVMIPTRR
jgi:hypothetical protein